MSTDSLFPTSWGLNETGNLFPDNPNSPDIPNSPTVNQGSYYGETIRGMSYVSPLATFKVTGLTVDEIANRYFPDSQLQSNANERHYCDVNSSFDGVASKNTDFLYTANNKYVFTLYLFYSRDAIKLAEAYECLKTTKQQVVFFIEDNTGDSSERYASVKISEDLRQNLRKGVETLTASGTVKDYLQKTFPGLTDEEINEILRNGSLEYKTTEKIATLLEAASMVSKALLTFGIPGVGAAATLFFEYSGPEIASKAFETLAKYIDKAKFDDYRWNPEANKTKEDGTNDDTYKPQKDFKPVLFPNVEELFDGSEEKVQGYMAQAVADLRSKIAEQDKEVRSRLGIQSAFGTAGSQKGATTINEYIYTKYTSVTQTISSLLDKVKDIDLSSILKEGIRVINAFFCGLWNGLVDAVSGLFLMVKYLFDALGAGENFMKNIHTELPKLMEHFDNIIQAFMEIDFAKITAHLVGKLVALAEGNFSISFIPIAYFCGAVYGFVISLVIEIAIGIVISGGVLSVEAVAEKFIEMFTSLFNAGASLAKGFARTVEKITVKLLDAFYKILAEITEFLRRGVDEFLRVIDELFEVLKTYSKKARTTFSTQIPLLGPHELELYEDLIKVFYKSFKKLLIAFTDEGRMLYKWKQLKAMNALAKKDIEELLSIRVKYLGKKSHQNIATLNVKVKINGKLESLEYKAISGYGNDFDGFCKSPSRDYIAKQLGMNQGEMIKHYDAISNNFPINRFNDSEHKIFAVFDEDMATFKVKYGENVEILEMNFQTILEPCNSCKKQILIRKDLNRVKKIRVEAVKLGEYKYAKTNDELIDL